MSWGIDDALPKHSWTQDVQPGGFTVTGGVGGVSFSWSELLRGAKELEGLADELRRVGGELGEAALQLTAFPADPQLRAEASAVQSRVTNAAVETSALAARFQGLADHLNAAYRLYAALERSLVSLLLGNIEEIGLWRSFERGTRPGYDAMGNQTLLPVVTEGDAWFHGGDEATAAVMNGVNSHTGGFETGPISATLLPDGDSNREIPDFDGSLSGLMARTGSEWEDGAGVENVIEVAVIEAEGRPDRYAVTLPGTKTWNPWDTDNPLDVTGDLAAISGSPHMARAVTTALQEAGAAPGAPVLLAGHSGGGLHARAIAANPAFLAEFDPKYVLTAGSPVGNTPLPDGTRGLNLHQNGDIVDDLDGRAAPDTKNNVTVEFQTEPLKDPQSGDELSAHSAANYAGKAELLETSDHPSVSTTVAGIAAFVPAGAKVSSYKFSLERRTHGAASSPTSPPSSRPASPPAAASRKSTAQGDRQ